MSEVLFSVLAAFAVELAKSAGHETGIKVVASLGPYLSEEQAGKAWHALVEACRRVQQLQARLPLPPEEWPLSPAFQIGNPDVPPDPGPM